LPFYEKTRKNLTAIPIAIGTQRKYAKGAKKILDLQLTIDEFYLVDIFNSKTNRKSKI